MTQPGRPSAPKPGPPPSQQRWFQERTSPYPWEQDALDHVRRLMPAAEPYRAWATFSFTAQSGRINECDLLIAVPAGLYLVEIKSHPGRLANAGSTWQFRGSDRLRTINNPLHFNDMKSKDLKSQLLWAARRLKISERMLPRVEPAVFLSATDLESHLDEVQRIKVYGRDDGASGLQRVWQDFLGLPPDRPNRRITPEFSCQILPRLLKEIGLRHSTAHLRFGDAWKMEPRPLDVGPSWEDRLAQRDDGLARGEGRVPLTYDPERQRFYPPALEAAASWTSTGSSTSFFGAGPGPAAADQDPHAVVKTKLAASVERGGFLAITVKGTRLPGAAQSLAAASPVQRVDLNRAFLQEFRALAEEKGQGWERVKGIDARFTGGTQISRGLASYVRVVWERLETRLLDQLTAPRTVLFLHDAGLLARYFDEGGRDLLVKLQNAARRPAENPHGLWLLCPVETGTQPPHLDGRTVEVIGDSERTFLTGAFLDTLRSGEGSAA